MNATAPAVCKPSRRLGEILCAASLITPDQLQISLDEQKKTGELLGCILVRLEFVAEALLHDLLGELLTIPVIDLDKMTIDPRIIALVPRKLIERHQVLPIRWNAKSTTLTLAMANPNDQAVLDAIQANIHTDIQLKGVLAGPRNLARSIERIFTLPTNAAIIDNPRQLADNPLQFVDALLIDALRLDATHIHIEPQPGQVSIRYRRDGLLSERCALHRDHLPGLLTHIRQLADIQTEDGQGIRHGHFATQRAGLTIECRVGLFPTHPDASLVLRIRDSNRAPVSLEQLGLGATVATRLNSALEKSTGITLVASLPNGGLSTTLHALAAYLGNETNTLVALDEETSSLAHPVRCIPGASRWLADPQRAPRELIELDADWLLVDRIRSPEALQSLMRAAMRGQRIVAGIHAHSTFGVFQQFFDMKIPPQLLFDTLSGILTQRLVRALCPACKKPHTPTDDEKAWLGDAAARIESIYAMHGCSACQGSGYRGRIGLFEMVPNDASLTNRLEQGASHAALSTHLNTYQIPTMTDAAIQRVIQGKTSFDEIRRLLG
ncbi:MAG: Flp pilus assembly complex ATPase component TadA [Magnetococcus sp. YQC-9]